MSQKHNYLVESHVVTNSDLNNLNRKKNLSSSKLRINFLLG